MTAQHRRDIELIFLSAVNAVLPQTVVPQYLEIVDPALIRIGEKSFSIPAEGVYIIALGKASIPMAIAAEQILEHIFARGIVVTKTQNNHGELRSKVYVGSHPVPDQYSIEAGDALIHFAKSIPPGALVLCMISGGASSLVESLKDPIQLDDLKEITEKLLSNGATINQLNAVRSRLSRIKGGGLSDLLSHASVHNLIISDVIGDDPTVIASGPTVQDSSEVDIADILESARLTVAVPEKEDSRAQPVQTIIIANLSKSMEAASQKAAQLGYVPIILSRSLQGEARDVAGVFTSISIDTVRSETSFPSGSCLIAGGETTVTVKGTGVGGRNSESALAASLLLQGLPCVSTGFLATDGDDGMTGVAGSIVDGATIHDDNVLDAMNALQEHDSFTFLDSLGLTMPGGPTGTNVNDLLIALVGQPSNKQCQGRNKSSYRQGVLSR